ncbi:hypothetical protein CDIK_2043 [Cucumispora dikerogammari]|nr:hypothetical protein CDIK_2043 [Cucumispora dikerogammari]
MLKLHTRLDLLSIYNFILPILIPIIVQIHCSSSIYCYHFEPLILYLIATILFIYVSINKTIERCNTINECINNKEIIYRPPCILPFSLTSGVSSVALSISNKSHIETPPIHSTLAVDSLSNDTDNKLVSVATVLINNKSFLPQKPTEIFLSAASRSVTTKNKKLSLELFKTSSLYIKDTILLLTILLHLKTPTNEFHIPNIINNPNQILINLIFLLYHNKYSLSVLIIYFTIIDVYYNKVLVLLIPYFFDNNFYNKNKEKRLTNKITFFHLSLPDKQNTSTITSFIIKNNISLITITQKLQLFLIHSYDFSSLEMKNISKVIDGVFKFYGLYVLFIINTFYYISDKLMLTELVENIIKKNIIEMFIIIITGEIHQNTMLYQWYYGSRLVISLVYFLLDCVFVIIMSGTLVLVCLSTGALKHCSIKDK